MSRRALVAVASLILPLAASAGTLTIKGSDTMVILNQRWAEAFMKKHPDVKVQVTGGGSGTGIAALLNGQTDLAAASRTMKDAEKAKLKAPPVELAVAKDGVSFFVNEANPITALTPDQLKGIYLGDVTTWKQVGGGDAPITVYSRESSSGTYVFVKEHLLKNADYTPSAQTLPGTAAVVNAVSKDKNGIGYGGAAYGKGTRELKVKTDQGEVAPTAENVKSGAYPLSRNLFFYAREQPQGDAKAFVDFCLSAEGQDLVEKVGYFRVK